MIQSTIGALLKEHGGSVKTGPFGTALKAAEYSVSGVPVISVGEVGDGRLVLHERTPRVSAAVTERLPDYLLAPGDIVFARKGAVDRSARVRHEESGWFLGSDGIRLRLPNAVDPTFVAYHLRSAASRSWLVQHATGTTMASLNQRVIESIPLSLPSLWEQRAIATVLGALDDKIDLNRRLNETLEETARALFKSWFVDFDPVRAKAEGRQPFGMDTATAALFPDGFEESELGEVPTGWSAVPLYDIATYINGAAYSAFEPNAERRGLPIIKIAELKAGVTAQTKFSDVAMDERYRIDRGDILFSWSGNPDTSIDTFVWPYEAAWLNQHIFRVIPNRPVEKPFVLETLRHLRPVFAEIARNKQTTGLGHVTAADLRRLRGPRPDDGVLRAWHDMGGPLQERSHSTIVECADLAKMRDYLLPRLLSGEVRVGDAEKLVGEAT